MGVALARQKLEQAGLVLAVFDSSRPLESNDLDLIEALRGRRVIPIINKTDLDARLDPTPIESALGKAVYISANDPSSLESLDKAVASILKTANLDPDQPILANERQRGCAVRARDIIADALNAAKTTTPDVVFALLSESLEALADLSGENVTESVLDEVFSRFCVGK